MLLFLYDRPIATQLLVIVSGEADASGTRSFLLEHHSQETLRFGDSSSALCPPRRNMQ